MKKFSEIYMYILGGLIVIGFFALLIVLALKPIPVENSEIMYLTVGALIAAFSNIVGYFYGSSKGSKEKTRIIANSISETLG